MLFPYTVADDFLTMLMWVFKKSSGRRRMLQGKA